MIRAQDFTPAADLAQGAGARLPGSSLDAAGEGALGDPPHLRAQEDGSRWRTAAKPQGHDGAPSSLCGPVQTSDAAGRAPAYPAAPSFPRLVWPEHDRRAAYERAAALRDASQVAERVRPAREPDPECGDDLAAAKGLALGVVISSVFWLLVAAVVAVVLA